MLFATRSNQYAPLLDDSQLAHDNRESSSSDLGPSTPYFDEKKRKSQPIPWTFIVVILCTLLNVALSVFPAMFSQTKVSQTDTLVTRQNIHLLRRPNQYIGFDKIPRPSPPVGRQLSTYPTLLSLVDSASPDTVFEDDFVAQMVHSGTITPDDRKVRITPTMSTIVQFRAIDWGMEICELHIHLPESYGQEGHSGSLGVYRINSTIPLDSSSLSYNTRPPRVVRQGVIPLGNGVVTWHRKFSCATEEVLSFELSCLPSEESGGDPGCFVEWVQIKDALPAIHMVQHSTI
ncbi:hypothetical protein L210DRAFT_3649499 [Boletus edulis BED1]|uniref:Ubiquitin 3 binding protein But2 C-terminal domain-containing protein n=1 Tax=Boletus edulis BED1 TaxID=1328754 RepID=A0AAD4BL15_BOLED|nr:hypothetical protein L210DRAFT_3649499 [Boletus edulis BED1]